MSTSPQEGATAAQCPRPVFVAGAALLGCFLVGFDTRLLTVGLPDLRGAFRISFDEASWLSTVAMAPQIVVAPAVAWLAAAFGVRRLLFWPSLTYAAISVLVPGVHDWPLLLVLHAARGLMLGLFVPATLMVIFRNLPTRWWIAALGIYAFRLAFSQSVGPLLFGFYFDNLGWQAVYWQDVVLAPMIALLVLLGTPREPIDVKLLARADWAGMALLGVGCGLVYAGLDQGNRLDWWNSGFVTTVVAAGGALIAGFLVNEAVIREPWASHRVILTRNVGLTCLVILCFSTTSLSSSVLIPGFLTTVGGLRPEQIGGAIFCGTALPLILTVPLAVLLLRIVDARIVLIVGFLAFAIAAQLGMRITHLWSPWTFLPMALLHSVGMGFTFLAAVVHVVANADPRKATSLAAYIQVLRLGGVEGAAATLATFVRQREQLHSYLLGLHVAATSRTVDTSLLGLMRPYDGLGGSETANYARGLIGLSAVVQREAYVLAYIDAFEITYWTALAGLLLVALLGSTPKGPLVPERRSWLAP